MTVSDKELIKEAQNSFKILLKYLGILDSRANILFLKWPDAMQSLISGDKAMFNKDMAILICQPLRVLACALHEYSNNEFKKQNSSEDIELIMEQAIFDPIKTKQALIRICNTEIFLLKSNGKQLEEIP
jgi:NACalpha-BTF3-like transcription factor